MKFSVVIPHSQDYPHVWFSAQDKFLRLDEYDINDYEVIIVENGSVGEHLRLVRRLGGKKGDNPKEWHSRGDSWMAPKRRNLRYIEVEKVLYHTRESRPTQLHSKPACNMGAWKAKGKYLVFCDSHVLFNDKWFHMADAYLEDHPEVTVLHTSLSWHNRFPVTGRRGYQYKLTFDQNGGDIWGVWNSHKVSDEPYPIAASGWGACVVRRDAYVNKYRGFPSMLRSYGAGEPYMDILAWMMGDEVHLHPDMHTVHFNLCRSRGYYQGGAIIMNRNKMLVTYILGGDKWLDAAYEKVTSGAKNKHPDWIPKYKENYNLAKKWGKFRRRHIEKNAVYTLEEALEMFDDKDIFH
jgi:hypothetical protein